MKKHLTKKLPVSRAVRIQGTDRKIALPFSINCSSYYGKTSFDIGPITFEIHQHRGETTVRPLAPIPESWFIDLNDGPIVDEAQA